MSRWHRLFSSVATWLGRFYGVAILGIGAVFLLLGVRGLIAYVNGTREGSSDPIACAIALIIAVLSLWAGTHLLRDAQLAREYSAGITREDDEIMDKLDQIEQLQQSDPSAARRLLEDLIAREDPKALSRPDEAGR